MNFEIILFESSRGERPVEQFAIFLDTKTRAKISNLLTLLEKHGLLLGMPYIRKMQSNLYELRVRGKVQIRIFFTIIGRNIILLHAFQKKSQKTPLKEIYVAQLRLRLVNKIYLD